MKDTYGLSMTGWLHRAQDVGILNDSRYKEMRRFFSDRGWVKKEPGQDYPREEPKLFRQLVFRALAEEMIGESKGAELLGVSLNQFAAMRNLKNAARSRHK